MALFKYSIQPRKPSKTHQLTNSFMLYSCRWRSLICFRLRTANDGHAVPLRLDRLHLLKLRLHLQFYQGNLFPPARNKQEASYCFEYGWPGKIGTKQPCLTKKHTSKHSWPEITGVYKCSCCSGARFCEKCLLITVVARIRWEQFTRDSSRKASTGQNYTKKSAHILLYKQTSKQTNTHTHIYIYISIHIFIICTVRR